MLASYLKKSFDGMRGENQFLRILVTGLAVALVVSSCSGLRKEHIVTVIPPTLTEQSWVSKTQSGSEYINAWALYIAMLLGNVTPSNASIIKEALGPILDPSIYKETMDVLDDQIRQIRQDRVSMNFDAEKVLRDPQNENRFFVTGRSISEGPAGGKKRTNRTYEFDLQIKNYKPNLSWISTNSGAPRTQDVIDREKKKEERMAARKN